MGGKTVLVLGGGIGGLMAASHLRRLSSPEHSIVVIERKQAFSACMSKLWVMTGERKDPGEGERELSRLSTTGIEFMHGDIQGIDPAAKTVQTTAGTLQGDYIVVALGAQLNPQAVPGFADSALNLYDMVGAVPIQRALQEF